MSDKRFVTTSKGLETPGMFSLRQRQDTSGGKTSQQDALPVNEYF